MKKFIVITSIFNVTEGIRKFSKLEGWQLIVVGDRKTPLNWGGDLENVIYLSPEDQLKLKYPILKNLPWNHYCRKMVGYLYAMEHGAEVIYDTDDDNIPYEHWNTQDSFTGSFTTISKKGFYNIYSEYTDKNIWPRGFPLTKILDSKKPDKNVKDNKIGVWQYLADEDPDVDAIYRLTVNEPVYFQPNKSVVLEEGTVCPFNSQNTFFSKEMFPLLYLPSFVTFRFTDILRGLVAQPLMWSRDYRLGFGRPTVIQKRNDHDYLKDFESEIPCFLHSEKVLELSIEAIDKNSPLDQNLINVYKDLHSNKIVSVDELVLLDMWLETINNIRMGSKN